MNRLRRWGLTVVTMASVATVLLFVTGWGTAAASSILSVVVTNTSSNPVPVRATNTDANGNVKVHEQGTAAVDVGNFPATQAVTVAAPDNQFNIFKSWGGASNVLEVIAGNSAGARYAISSVTLASTGSDNSTAELRVATVDASTGRCESDGVQQLIVVAAPAHGTASASLPQPLVSASTTADPCLMLYYSGTASISIVGHVIH